MLDFRSEIENRLSASLRRDLRRQLPRLYDRARRDLSKGLELYGEAAASARPPERCPSPLDQIVGDFWPNAANDRGRQEETT